MKILAALLVGLLLVGCRPSATSAPTSLADLDADAVKLLGGLPSVASVTRRGDGSAAVRRVIQIDDWHFVRPEAFSADLAEDGAADAEIDAAYREHLADVEAVHANPASTSRRECGSHSSPVRSWF
jgi:hypothetical protein